MEYLNTHGIHHSKYVDIPGEPDILHYLPDGSGLVNCKVNLTDEKVKLKYTVKTFHKSGLTVKNMKDTLIIKWKIRKFFPCNAAGVSSPISAVN